jgi:hypothetical protein
VEGLYVFFFADVYGWLREGIFLFRAGGTVIRAKHYAVGFVAVGVFDGQIAIEQLPCAAVAVVWMNLSESQKQQKAPNGALKLNPLSQKGV